MGKTQFPNSHEINAQSEMIVLLGGKEMYKSLWCPKCSPISWNKIKDNQYMMDTIGEKEMKKMCHSLTRLYHELYYPKVAYRCEECGKVIYITMEDN